MKYSQAQINYLEAESAHQAAFENLTESDDTWDAYEAADAVLNAAKLELIVWSREMLSKLCKVAKQPKSSLATVYTMFDAIINGQRIDYDKEKRLILICLKISVK